MAPRVSYRPASGQHLGARQRLLSAAARCSGEATGGLAAVTRSHTGCGCRCGCRADALQALGWRKCKRPWRRKEAETTGGEAAGGADMGVPAESVGHRPGETARGVGGATSAQQHGAAPPRVVF
eukprot:CAMPEP_0175187482 /NCGR_PEP_ID=MMETSP0093-20121207/2931_1 /TAXON_ID=311494 /ORGANISM="Alexandrium monilatum, Strain CCMP3105" /LENGTH=123 /DNA_ID=CAMNT_0016480239 /DNA_START=154 /DNA_END=522 /DNA_ORIENTATION=-